MDDPKANNRVILVTDGDFNVGISSPKELEDFIASKRSSGIFLSVIGVGRGNFQDANMKKLANAGNGNYAYLDSVLEAKKVMVSEFGGTLFTVAKDVKVQIEFNPAQVAAYRLLGYENRLLKAKDFNDDKKDAGEIGSGHTMTAFYEIVPVGAEKSAAGTVDPLKYQKSTTVESAELFTVKMRWKAPDGDKSKLKEIAWRAADIVRAEPSEDFRFASAVAEFALMLEGSKFKVDASFADVLKRARGAKGADEEGYRAEFIRLVEMAELLERGGLWYNLCMNNEFPDWGRMTPAYAEAELPRLIEEAEKGVAAVEAAEPQTFEEFVWRLDDAVRPLHDLWGMVMHMTSVVNSDAWRKVEEDFQPRLVEFSLRVGQSRRLYDHAKGVLGLLSDAQGDATRRRVLEKMVESAERDGVGLEGAAKARFNEIQASLAKLGSDFRNSVIDATAAFKFEKDGKTYTIDDASYPETMKHCADREVREALYRARVTRSPDNEPRIKEILGLRREKAELLGFADYAEMSVAAKCAPSVAAVYRMIDELDEATERRAAEEAEEIGGDAIRPWDVAFESERLRERRYAYSEEELKRCFTLGAVLSGLFRMAKFLFGIDVEEVKGDAKPPVWHPDVRFFSVREKGETIAHFYLDPYVRPGEKSGGAWMNEFFNRCDRLALKPLAVIVTNFPLPGEDGESRLPMREVETVFHEFGHALQCMLTRIGEEGAAGINLVEWDAVEVASQFMENWCLDDRTGIAVPAELKAKVRAAKNFRAASQCRRQMAMTKVDMDLHSGDPVSDPDAVKRADFAHFGVPTIPEERFLCAFQHIFAGGYAAGYYGYKWAEVMSADCYGAFEEAGLGDDEAVRRVGARYRETILALGGSRSALDVFREFRGRDPEIAAMLRQQGLAAGAERGGTDH